MRRKALIALGVATAVAAAAALLARRSETAELFAVSPRFISNQTTYPVKVYGAGLGEGMSLAVASSPPVTVSVLRLDATLGLAQIPPLPIPPARTEAVFRVTLAGATGEVELRVVNDAAYPVAYALAEHGGTVYVASPTTDEIVVLNDAGEVSRLPVGDRPRALAVYEGSEGRASLVVAHELDDSLWIVGLAGGEVRKVTVGTGAQDVIVDGDVAYVSNRVEDAVLAVRLLAGRESIERRYPAGVNPRALATGDGRLFVSNLGSNDLSIVELATGAETRVVATPRTAIIGGHTERFQPLVMGSKSARDVVYSRRLGVAFVSSIGPNIGPNPERMEVSMNGGVGVVDRGGRFVRHVALERGCPEGLALDEARGILYAADISSGTVVAFDAGKLAESDDRARAARLSVLAVEPPGGTRLMRPEAELSLEGRPGKEVHSGPRALGLSSDGLRLFVLNQLTRTVDTLDVADPAAMRRIESRSLAMNVQQTQRALGETVYFTDLGHSRMSCDTCHYEGHADGVLFTKAEPIHIYRVPTLLGSAETAPYFTPARFPSLEVTATVVLGRNRFHDPDPVPREARAVAAFNASLTTPPNPYLARGWPAEVAVGSSASGDPLAGVHVFERLRCGECHPPPSFTTDQDAASRGQLYDVAHEVTLPLRLPMQDAVRYPLPAPALVGLWDNFPLLHSGAGGMCVRDELVVACDAQPLRALLSEGAHGGADALSRAELDDLIAYLTVL